MFAVPAAPRAPAPCAELLRDLLDSFPRRVAPDYFRLCGVARDALLLPDRARAAFEELSAFTVMLADGGAAQGDRYADATGAYFRSLGLTPAGFRAVRALRDDGMLDGGAPVRDLLDRLLPAPSA